MLLQRLLFRQETPFLHFLHNPIENELSAASEAPTSLSINAPMLLPFPSVMLSKGRKHSIKALESLSSLRPRGVKSFDPACSV